MAVLRLQAVEMLALIHLRHRLDNILLQSFISIVLHISISVGRFVNSVGESGGSDG